MDDLRDYIEWLGDVDFNGKPFNDVDAVILCLISYFDLAPVLDKDGEATVAECMPFIPEGKLKLKITGGDLGNVDVFRAAAASKRFGQLYISDYVEEMDLDQNLQFSAVTFSFEDEWSFIAFRGTDSSLIGWKEDFMIGYTQTVAQRKALEYARRVITKGDEADLDGIPSTTFLRRRSTIEKARQEALRTWYIGGHSKGGNLALYAAALLPEELMDRVEHVWDLDGPGFAPEVMSLDLIEKIDPKTTKVIPEYDVIGRIMEVKITDTKVIVSNNMGILEHNIASWCVDHGRLGLSGKSVELLLTEDYDEARQIAAAMGEDNTERRQIETEILQKIDLKIQQNPSLIFDRVIVIDGENWHQGVIGIVASRVKETYGKPAIVISRDGENAKASGRSVEGFALCDAVAACSDLLTHYGGHPMAVGLSLKSDNIELFRKRINEYANSVDSMPFDALKIDCKLNPAGISLDIAEDLTHMQPFGAGNPTPIFGLYNMKINSIIPLSNNKHLKLIVSRVNSTLSAMLFFTSTEEFPYQKGDAVDLAVALDVNEYNGNKSVSIIVKDIKAAADNTEEMLKSQRIFEDFCRSNTLDREQLKSILPSRDDFAVLYRFLRANGGYSFSFDTLVYKLGNKLSLGKIRVALEAMNELGLITISEGMNISKITVNQVSAKVNLESAAIIKRLTEVTR